MEYRCTQHFPNSETYKIRSWHSGRVICITKGFFAVSGGSLWIFFKLRTPLQYLKVHRLNPFGT
jgi:hypothetical protein